MGSAACPACAYRDREVTSNTGYLLTLLREHDVSRERFVAGPGLCMPHLVLTWRTAAADRHGAELLLDAQRRAVRRLRDELTEHIRKQGAEAKGEPAGPEADSWQRALWLTGGWPDTESVLDAVQAPQ